jgi:aliphatic sulfonates family ABC transporter substrate-binding protein
MLFEKGVARKLFVAAILIVLLFVPACERKKVTVIRVGSTAPGHLNFLVSQQLHAWDKEFAKDGIRIEYLPFTGGGAEAAMALSSGSLEFMFTASDPAIRIAASGADVNAIGLSSFAQRKGMSGGSSIIVRTDSPIHTVRDLKGKKIAYLAGTVRHATLVKTLRLAGLTINDIQSLQLDSRSSTPALLRGDIDALVEGEASVWKLLKAKEVRVLVDGRNHPEWATPSVITASGAFVRGHPDLVKRFLAIDKQCADWADAHPDETLKLQSERSGLPLDYLRAYHPDGSFFTQPAISEAALNSLREEERFMRSVGLMKGSVDYRTWVVRKYVDEVYAESSAKQ